MKPKSYWTKRSDQIAARQYRKAGAHELELKREYDRATKAISRDVEAFYGRYADNNIVSLADAQKALTSVELQQHRMSLEEFTRKAKDNTDGRYTQELNNAYYKVRVSRLEALESQIGQHIESLAGGRQISTGKLLGDAYTDTYYRTMHEVQTGLGFGQSFARIDSDGLEKILGTRLYGRNWSQRIWDDRSKLRQEMHKTLSQGFIRGDNVGKMSRSLAERMGVSYNRARVLVQTETAFFAEQATMDSYKESGIVSEYEVLVSLDDRTCNICGPLDGQVFPLSKMEVGVTYPPLHARCRCTTVPYFDDEIDPGQRIARGLDGESYYVPGDITYDEWKQQVIEDNGHEKWNAKANEKTDREFYERYREIIGKDAAGTTLEEFQRIKYSHPDKWAFVQLDYKRQLKLKDHPDMALPNALFAFAAEEKFSKYLFNPDNPKGFAKGNAFESRLGYNANNWNELQNDILMRSRKNPARLKGTNNYGELYEQQMILYGKNGKPANVVVGWIHDGKSTKMTSAYIKEVKVNAED